MQNLLSTHAVQRRYKELQKWLPYEIEGGHTFYGSLEDDVPSVRGTGRMFPKKLAFETEFVMWLGFQ